MICDISLGNASGIDLVRTLRKSGRFGNVPIVAVTAGSMGQAPEAYAAGFTHYLLKPIEPKTFLAEITRCLAGGVQRQGDVAGRLKRSP
jgi:CheY-like chemotaxis protein